jgi:DNA-binding NarL/FixJ family response regulator
MTSPACDATLVDMAISTSRTWLDSAAEQPVVKTVPRPRGAEKYAVEAMAENTIERAPTRGCTSHRSRSGVNGKSRNVASAEYQRAGGDSMRVIVADDDTLLREGLASLLQRSGFDVVGQASDGTQLLALARDKKPELVVADIRMPPTHTTEGLDAARVIREELPDIGILVLSAHVDVRYAMELLTSGSSSGYLLKSRVTDVAEFVDSLERIAKGSPVLDPAVVQALVLRREEPLGVLSTRELEVLALMAEGRSNAGIAKRLCVTEGTVEKHVRSILLKLDLPEMEGDNRRVLAVITFLKAD